DRVPTRHPTPATKLDRRHLQQLDSLRRARQGRTLRSPRATRDPDQRNSHRPEEPPLTCLMELGYAVSGKTRARTVDGRRAAYRESMLHQELHTHRTFDNEQVGPSEKAKTCSALAERRYGLEPSTPSRGIGRL